MEGIGEGGKGTGEEGETGMEREEEERTKRVDKPFQIPKRKWG